MFEPLAGERPAIDVQHVQLLHPAQLGQSLIGQVRPTNGQPIHLRQSRQLGQSMIGQTARLLGRPRDLKPRQLCQTGQASHIRIGERVAPASCPDSQLVQFLQVGKIQACLILLDIFQRENP